MATVTRADWQRLAEERLLNAQALLAAGRWAAAYYLAGYAIECGLKACILVRLMAEPEVVFDQKRYSEKCWSHDPKELAEQAALLAVLDADGTANRALADNWFKVKRWNELARYSLANGQPEAESLVDAVCDTSNGVMQWIRNHW